MFARTERLLLRPGWAEDAPALHRAICDEGIVRNLASAPWPYRPEDAIAFLATERQPQEPAMLVFRRTSADPELIGSVGFGRRPDGELEFGYWIARSQWGRGYATEAGRAAVEMARKSLRLTKLNAGHFVDNPASGRVLQKLGFKSTGRTASRYSAGRNAIAPCNLFELDLSGTDADVAPECELAMMAA
ncbi:MAG: 50S ribosomal protein acetyltransferase [uncultured Sphingosinicella sp.]|uniref:50S ribosomal protein acetyltransferase n=1 Tax=uncultured Sphingosinicella sp. TaxID=478748 RepID=A0A6J4TP42_9SPHN|nr:GNAT family N-acetyltransferase [uncultured Sphingosinicella sp.]CAA9528505.1 MAG: 50S ribosomal protein acetyltransferase [uncultured Sphingosinicella sp.]